MIDALPKYGPEELKRKMENIVRDLWDKHKKRKNVLHQMSRSELRELANDYLLPQDLNRSEIIKYVLLKEFPAR